MKGVPGVMQFESKCDSLGFSGGTLKPEELKHFLLGSSEPPRPLLVHLGAGSHAINGHVQDLSWTNDGKETNQSWNVDYGGSNKSPPYQVT
ncbi:hypothetical protein E2C01_004742 [Portunus trituberculatus]|uniref:Uncharacterized protein n=1 Tax=Portunus trituberculatus TaxID=210409 RepID=A0A5B7CS64_PORTR|nr:hypothetical protein [Portunus trituberculatus]